MRRAREAPGMAIPAAKTFCRRCVLRETSRVLEAGGEVQGLCIPLGQWHIVNVLEPTVIMECKDGKYEPLSPEDMIGGGERSYCILIKI